MVLSFFLSSTEELRGAHPRNIYPDNNFMEVNARAVIERRKVNMRNTSKYDVDGVPSLKEALPLGFQHTLAMIVSNMLPGVLIAGILGYTGNRAANFVQCMMLSAAIGTLLQLYTVKIFKGVRTGSGLPIVMGMNYVFLGVYLSASSGFGMNALMGAIVVGGIFMVFLGFFIQKILRYFTPTVTAIVILALACDLIKVAMRNIGGGTSSDTYGSSINFFFGLGTALLIVLLGHFGKGFVKELSILIGMIVAYIVAVFAGLVDFSSVAEASWIAIPKPFAFGALEFNPSVIIMVILLYIIAVADYLGATTVCTNGAFGRDVTDKEVSSLVVGVGLGSVVSGIFNGMPVGVYSQNCAMVAMNKVVSRFVIAMSTVALFLGGFSPKIGAIFQTIPNCVLGGATLVIFSQIFTSGISIVKMNNLSKEQLTIVGVASAFGIGYSYAPEVIENLPSMAQTILSGSNVVIGCIIALVLQGLFSLKKQKETEK